MGGPFLRRAITTGLLGGIPGVHLSLVGMVTALQTRELISGVVSIGTAIPFLFIIIAGWYAGGPNRALGVKPSAIQALGLGALAGALGGAVLAVGVHIVAQR